MGTLTRSLANNITTGGVILPAGITNATVADITSFPNASGGTLVLLSTQTASASANISFTTGLDSTYDEYIFKFYNMHSSANDSFQFNMSTDGGSNYNVTKTTTYFEAVHDEADTAASLAYKTARDLAQSTAFQILANEVGTDNDKNASGSLTLFNPSSTVFVKHFIANFNSTFSGDYTVNSYIAGYGNTTSAVNAVRFQFSSGNIDDGIIKLYGVKKS
jgi:hypothetical protein